MQKYGLSCGVGWKNEPAGFLDKCDLALGVYYAIKGFRAADNIVTWTNQNPGLWKTYEFVMELRKEMKHAG